MGVVFVDGTEAQVADYCSMVYRRSSRAYWVDVRDADHWRRWPAMRRLVPQLRSSLGPDGFAGILARHRAALSVLYPSLSAELSAEQIAARGLLTARLDSNTTHNWYAQRPLLEAWKNFLGDALEKAPGALIVPAMHRVDAPTRAVLRSLLSGDGAKAFDLLFGSPQISAGSRGGSNSILAPLNLSPPEDIGRFKKVVTPFLVIPGIEKVAAQEVQLETVSDPPPLALDRMDEDVEGEGTRIFGVGKAATTEITSDHVALGFRAMYGAFEAYDFATAARWALRILPDGEALEEDRQAELHNILALSGHNLQFRTEANMPLADFLEEHFGRALDLEQDPSRRICLLYRLAVTTGRRKGDLESAYRFSCKALEEVEACELRDDERDRLRAWALNIRAFVLMRRKETDAALDDLMTSFRLMESQVRDSPSPSREVVYFYTLLPDNLATLYEYLGKEDEMRDWLYTCAELSDRLIQEGDRFSAAAWIRLHLKDGDVLRAAEVAEKGFSEAVRELDVERQVNLGYYLLDLRYRLGDAEGALEIGQHLLRLRELLGWRDEQTLPMLYFSARAARRAKHLRPADDFLAEALGVSEDVLRKLEVLGEKCRLAALRKDFQSAERLANEVIDEAVASGQAACVLLAARVAGDASLQMGNRDEARESYLRGLDIAEEPSSIPNRVHRFHLGVGALAAGIEDDGLVRLLLGDLPDVLRHDGEAWWSLEVLKPYADRLLESRPPAESEVPRQVLEKALAQRQHRVSGGDREAQTRL